MTEPEVGKKTTITGIVVAYDWDDDGNVISVAISTPLEDEYVVRRGASGEDLMELLGSKVVATGIVSSGTDWTKMIAVERYEILEYAGDEEPDDTGDYDDEEEFEDEEELEHRDERW
jgi:hypothetical protein